MGLSYEVFDGDPTTSGPCSWGAESRDDAPNVADYTDPAELAEAVLDWAVGEIDDIDYSIGDRLWVIVYGGPNGNVEHSRTLQLDDFSPSYSDVTEWETTHSYVACLYGTDGDQPGDCEVQIGKTPCGAWYVRHGDDGCKEEYAGPFATRVEAEASAKECADENNEAVPGEDADDMRQRLLAEAAGEPDPNGEYCVYWSTVGEDEHVVERYATQEAASAATELHNIQLHARHSGRLLCGYEVRTLVNGEWIGVDEQAA